MTMETTDYVSYPTALALKRAGFDWPCDSYYCAFDNETDVRFWSIHPAQSQNGFCAPKDKVIADAPTLWQAQKWLREKKGYVISIHPESKFFEKTYQHTGWNYSIILISKTGIMSSGPIGNILVEKYEQALSAGIAAALELIEEKGE